VLGLRGFEVLHLSGHGVGEHGKDVIARDPQGRPVAFQLKAGSISNSVWRQIHGEVMQLLDVPINYPGVDPREPYVSYLVTNGTVTEDVRLLVSSINQGRPRRKRLELIARDQLLNWFVDAQGDFLPERPDSIHALLGMYLGDGRANLDVAKYCGFIESMICDGGGKSRDSSRRIGQGLLLGTYAITPHAKAGNHLAIATAWVIMATSIAAAAERHRLATKWWSASMALCREGLNAAMEDLKAECMDRGGVYLEGSWRGDGGVVYKARQTLLLGWLCAHELARRMSDESYAIDGRVMEMARASLGGELFLWGESAVPLFYAIGQLARFHGEAAMAASLYTDMLRQITEMNDPKNRVGLPDPYYSADAILAALTGVPGSHLEFRDFVGHAYMTRPLIESLVRDNWRRGLSRLWPAISRLMHVEFIPAARWQFLLWRTPRGIADHWTFETPQSWKTLVAEASRPPTRLPKCFPKLPWLVPYFVLAYPHRFCRDTVRFMDSRLVAF
jgi:hypothetical protein